ncbi:MAG TPA: accessory factor UbiK family protein [Alcanivoracaceae bacterium]|nr:accessory factor UbiK family protein [Alcanivoracaceae bacterium]
MSQIPLIDRIAAEVSARMPSGLGELRHDVERNVQAVLQEALARFDLIGREEFEVQRQVLLRTREKLEELEKIVAELEKNSAS